MDLLKKITKGILGVALWSYIFAALFIEGTYIPFVSGTDDSSPAVSAVRPASAQTQRPSAPDVVKEIYAMELYREFQSNSDAAEAKYGDKTLIVSGLHFHLQENPFSSGSGSFSYVYIEEQNGWKSATSVVRCGVSEAVAQSILAVEEPHIIKLKGQVERGYLMKEVNLRNCTLVSLD